MVRGGTPPQGGIIRGLAGAAGRPALTVTPPVIPPPPQFADNQPPAPPVPPPSQFADNPPAPPVPPKSQAARDVAAAIRKARSSAPQPTADEPTSHAPVSSRVRPAHWFGASVTRPVVQRAEHRPAPVSPPAQAPQATSPPPTPPVGSKPPIKPKPAIAQRVSTRLVPAEYAEVSMVETILPSPSGAGERTC